MVDDAQTTASSFADEGDKAAAQRRLADVVPRLTADQAEEVLGRLREGGTEDVTPTVAALLDRLETVGDKRRASAARKWFGDSGRKAERAYQRAQNGTRAEQSREYRAYLEDLAGKLEDETRGSTVKRHIKWKQARGEQNVSTTDVLASSPDTIRARLSDEALEALAKLGPPLSFDAWRYQMLGARDQRAVASFQRRTGSYFSEYG